MRTHFALVFLLAAAACTAPAPTDSTMAIPAGTPDEIRELAEAIDSIPAPPACDLPADPQVLLEALPTSYGPYSQVGDSIAERGELQGPEGPIRSSTALRTLTINDEQYIGLTVLDECGMNTNALKYALFTDSENEYGWTRTVTVEGREAKLSYDSSTGFYAADVLLRDRALVTINGDGASEDDTLKVAAMVDYSAIEAAMS